MILDCGFWIVDWRGGGTAQVRGSAQKEQLNRQKADTLSLYTYSYTLTRHTYLTCFVVDGQALAD